MAIVGGETAEMPGTYRPEIDIVGLLRGYGER